MKPWTDEQYSELFKSVKIVVVYSVFFLSTFSNAFLALVLCANFCCLPVNYFRWF